MIKPINEDCFLITLSEHIDLSLTAKIADLVKQIEISFAQCNAQALVDITPSYNTILVQYNLLKISPIVAENLLISLVDSCQAESKFVGKLIELPVYYDLSVGWDLQKVASENHLTIAEVIQIHSEKVYQVCAIGFAPGFAFLAEVDDKITQTRHVSPRAFGSRWQCCYRRFTNSGISK
ncbi:5-oxoprolinase subunit B family protein [Psychromonas sp. KJ10-10]|uniref:5-oxoprolinase subunit B family protein n=1 Tax=Psychromonas sp. KJ10-10 TaxID=3391823 RepID=UPI0039B58F0A